MSKVRLLTATEGYYLTQATRNDAEKPIMSKQVINPQSEWVEIPIAEGDAIIAQWQAEQERKMQAEMNNATR